MDVRLDLAGLALSVLVFVVSIAPDAIAQTRARVWVSSLDMKHTLTEKDPVAFEKKHRRRVRTIEVDPATTYQSILGIGSSLEHATCFNLSKLDAAKRERVIESLVDPDTGIGMSLMRVCIGTSDFVGEPWYSYDDQPEGETDPDLEHFSIAKDRTYVLPVLRTALEKNPDLRFFASPWSPPGWMKSSGQMCSGRLLPQYYGAFAQYLVRFVQAYDAEGIPLYAMTIQNEPGVNVRTYPSCMWNGEVQRDFIKDHLGPAMTAAGLETRVWCFDHNFNNTKFPHAILSDPQAAQYVDGTAFHHYEGKVDAMGALAAEFPDKHVYFTEGSVYKLFGAVRIIEFFNNMARSYNAWVTVIDHNAKPNNGPHQCSPTCIVLNSDTLEIEYRFDYYMYGHFSKFIDRGAVRLSSTPGDRRFANVAFRNPDGSFVLVVVNNSPEDQGFQVRCHGAAMDAGLAPRSMATYVWRD